MTSMLMLSIIEEFLPGYRPLFPHVVAEAPRRDAALVRLEAAIAECERPGNVGTRLKVTVSVDDLALLISAVKQESA